MASSPPDNYSVKDWVEWQRRSSDLVLYSVRTKNAVLVRWPLHNGNKILPNGMRSWLLTRGLHWACFCPKKNDFKITETQSCRIIENSATKQVIAMCGLHTNPLGCGFFLDLTKIYSTTSLTDTYPNLVTLDAISKGANPFDSRIIEADFFRHFILFPKDTPIYNGYCGEFNIQFARGTVQLASPDDVLERARRRAAQGGPYSLSAPIGRRTFQYAASSPSRHIPQLGGPNHSAMSIHLKANLADSECLRKLLEGLPISPNEAGVLLQPCSYCNQFFLQGTVKRHQRSCNAQSREDDPTYCEVKVDYQSAIGPRQKVIPQAEPSSSGGLRARSEGDNKAVGISSSDPSRPSSSLSMRSTWSSGTAVTIDISDISDTDD